MEPEKLTEEQILNWRKALSITIGPYAFICSKEEIQLFRDTMQKNINNLDKPPIQRDDKRNTQSEPIKQKPVNSKPFNGLKI
jgi:hypothetical protein